MTRRTAVIARVLQLMKAQWWRIILTVLCALALPLAVDVFRQMVMMSNMPWLTEALTKIYGGTGPVYQDGLAMIDRFWTAPSVQAVLWLSLASFLISPVLTMGLYNFLVRMLKDPGNGEGVEGDVRFVFSRMKDFFRALGCLLLIALRIFLAALPGLALYIALMTMTLLGAIKLSAMVLMLSGGGMIAAMVMAIRTAYLYELAPVRLAEHTGEGIRAALNRSRQLMLGHRWEYFTCQLTWYWIILLVSLISSSLSMGLGLTLDIVAKVLVNTLMLATTAGFWLIREGEEAQLPVREQSQEKEPLLEE